MTLHFKNQPQTLFFLVFLFLVFFEGISSYLEFNSLFPIELTRVAYLYFSTVKGLLLSPTPLSEWMVDFCFSLQFTVCLALSQQLGTGRVRREANRFTHRYSFRLLIKSFILFIGGLLNVCCTLPWRIRL